MERRILTWIIGVALLLCAMPTHAEACYLVNTNKKAHNGSRMPARPLVVDLVGHTLTLPSYVIGYTLTFKNEEGEEYTYTITDANVDIPMYMNGSYEMIVSNENSSYSGIIYVE